MAKPPSKRPRRSASTVAVFKSGMPAFFRDVWLASATRFAQLLEDERAQQMEDIVQAHMQKNGLSELPQAYDQPFIGYKRFTDAIASYVTRMTNALGSHFEHNLRMLGSSNPEVFRFRISNPNNTITFGPTSIPGAEQAFAAKDPFAPTIRIFKEVGIDLNSPTSFDKVLVTNDYEQAPYHRSVDLSGKSLLGRAPTDKTRELLKTGVITAKLECNVVITDNSMVITPFIDIEIDTTLYDNVVDYEGAGTNGAKREPLYIYMWMQQAMKAAASPTGVSRWKGNAVVDLRMVTKKLAAVKQKFGQATPRVNSDGFAIGGDGLPMLVPNIDRGAEYVATISKSTKVDKNGVYDFATSHLTWANEIILVDWFNDYILYANPLGEIEHFPLLGVRALDPASEMLFMNTPVDANKRMIELLNNVHRLVEVNVTEDEAKQFVAPETMEYFATTTLPSYGQAYMSLQSAAFDRSTERTSYTNKRTPALKHLLGFDFEDSTDQKAERNRHDGGIVRAYLRALYRKRNKLDAPIFLRLSGFEYVLFAAEKYSTPERWQKAQSEQTKRIQEMNSTYQYPATIELPNLDIGDKAISALMPHQVRYLGAMRDGVQAGVAGVATGGGKGLMGPLDIIQQMALGQIKRPLICTKPRLVKENITEINRISGGKMNVVPLRTRNLRHLIRKAGLRTAQDFLAWAHKLPPNTIFVCAYSDFATNAQIFADLDVPGRALWYDVQLSQMVHLQRLIGIDFVFGDESHLIKKLTSRRSKCAYSIFASAKATRIASGTLVANVPKDYVGQFYALNPTIFGNNIEQFEDTYHIRGGQLTTDNDARRLNFRKAELARVFEADESDWSFVLPLFKDQIEHYSLTPLQEEFYDILMQEAKLEMLARLGEDGGSKKKPPKPVKVESDDGDDDDEDEDDPEDFEDDDERFIAIATTSLAKVEQFIIAPDMNEQYVAWVKAPKGDDLISPAVKKLDEYLDRHFQNVPKDRWAQEKVLVFGINKVASIHLFKYSKWAKQGLRYTASAEEEVRRFKTEADRVVLYADETSLREGENLQMCSVVCRMQPMWTPGDYKQAAARAYRPDPRGVYADRESVRHVWFLADGNARGRPTVNSVKLATMISKAINNARLRYEDDMAWRKISPEFEGLKKMRMNLELIFNTQAEDVQPYLNKWRIFNNWVADQVQKAKVREAENLEREHNVDLIKDGKIIDIKAFLKLAMRPVTSKTNLPGSKRVYTPWELGATPADVYKLDLVVLGGQKVEIGTPVMTEFGAAVIVKAEGERTVKVELFGGKTVGLRRLSVAIPSTDQGARRLKNIINNKAEWKKTYTSPRISSTATATDVGERTAGNVPPKSGQIKTPALTPKARPEPQVDEDADIEVFTQIINGWPFLGVAAEEAPPAMLKLDGWTKIDPYVAVTFASWAQADKFLDILVDKFFLSQPKFDKLVAELETLRTGRAMRLTQRVKPTEVRSFFLAQHKMKGKATNGRFIIDPYFIAFDDTVYLAFDRKTHAPAVLNWLNRAVAQVSGMKKARPNEGFVVYGFKTMAEASEGLRAAAKYLSIDEQEMRDEINELKEDLKQFSTKATTPRRGTRR